MKLTKIKHRMFQSIFQDLQWSKNLPKALKQNVHSRIKMLKDQKKFKKSKLSTKSDTLKSGKKIK